MALDKELLYRIVGGKVRMARERIQPKLSQAQLAKRLGISRASIVNIEAGRQCAPLHLLWQIAETLNTELALLLPRHDEYAEASAPVKLDAKTIAQIEVAANGDPKTKLLLTQFVGKVKSQEQPR
jgi:DNA-binding XRE family transcriptional regulator